MLKVEGLKRGGSVKILMSNYFFVCGTLACLEPVYAESEFLNFLNFQLRRVTQPQLFAGRGIQDWSSKMDRWKPLQQGLPILSRALKWTDGTLSSKDFPYSSALRNGQMEYPSTGSFPYFRRWSLPYLSCGKSSNGVEGGSCPKTFNWMWGLAGSAYKIERDHPNIWKVATCISSVHE